MKIGFGQADITPKGGKVYLIGQFNERITDQVMDPLHAVAMVIESENARTVWVTADSLWVCEGASDLAYKYACEVIPDLKEEEFVLSATHIHTGPSMSNDIYCSLTGERDEPKGAMNAVENNVQFAVGVQNAIREAVGNLAEARVDFALSRVQTGVQRRVVYKDGSAAMYGSLEREDFLKMEGRDGGPSQLLYVYNMKDELVGVVANVPCTAQCDEHATYITADYWGVVREKICAQWGDGVKVLPLCRAVGDQSPHQMVDALYSWRKASKYHGRQAAIDMGERVARFIIENKERVLASYGGDSVHAQGMRTVQFPVWQPTQEEYDQAMDYLENPDNFTEDGRPKDAFKKSCAVACKERHERGDQFYPCNIYAARLGDILFISSPFELFTEYADRIRMAFANNTIFDVELTHGCMGYLATRNAIQGGGYSAMIFNGVCNADGGEVLIEESVALLKELCKQ